MMDINFVLVTGATGFIGAHIVDALLARGLRVRGATRSMAKGTAMMNARPQYKDHLEFVQIPDFQDPGDLAHAVKGVDGIIHTASPFTYNTTNNESELLLPAINGVKALFAAASSTSSPSIKRVVLTSSFAAVMDSPRKDQDQDQDQESSYFTYTAEDWNPLSYDEAADKSTSAVVAYRGSKKFAERAAWAFMDEEKPEFDLVSLCPPMTFGPVVHPLQDLDGGLKFNESNAMLWRVASSSASEGGLPVARVPFWVDVRDLAALHVGALLERGAGGKRYTVCAPERFSYGLAAEIIRGEFEELRDGVYTEGQAVDESYGLDGEVARRELALGDGYRLFRESVRDLVRQGLEMRST